MFLRHLAFVVLTCAGLVTTSHAQVKASLISTTTDIKAGQSFTVALRLEHDAHWHTYWINPGTGYPTSLTWQLPDGWKAGEIQWPTPVVLKSSAGEIIGNGYEGDALLPVTLTPPANLKLGETVTLRAKAEWLMCAETCVPGEAAVSLTLPVVNESPAVHFEWTKRITELPLPRPPEGWSVTARSSGKTVVLALKSADGKKRVLNAPYFFASDGYIQYDQPQKVTTTPEGYELTLPISPSADKPAIRLVGVLSTQNPLAGLQIDTPVQAVSAATSSGKTQGGLAATLTLAFVGGLILNLMPCVFPVLGIKILGFVNQAGADRKKVTLHGITFTAGVLLSFWTLAGLLSVLRASGDQLGWGFQLQSPIFVFALAAVMLIFALSMSGVFEFGLSATGVGSGLQSKSGYAGSFFTGVLATVVATPCSAPFLAPALGAALTLSTIESFTVFTAIAIGLSLPYLLLSIFPGAVKILPRPGGWMETFKQFMAFPLYATVGYLVWVLAGQTNENGLLMALFGLTLIAMAVWLYGRYTAPGSKPARVRIGLIGGLILLALGVWLGWPQAPAPTDITWKEWSAQTVAEAQRSGKMVYVDFTARWCATCQANKKLVFGSADVKHFFQEKGIVTLKADWTNKDPRITAELAKFGRSAVPFNLVYKPGTPEPIILPELLTAGIVLDAVKN